MTTNVPNIELEALRLDGLDVEPLCGGDGVDVLAGEGLEDRRLAGVVETKQQDPQLPVGGRFQLSGRIQCKRFAQKDVEKQGVIVGFRGIL